MPRDLTDQEKTLIREKIQEKYAQVAAGAPSCFRYPTGAEGAQILGYPPDLWQDFPEGLINSFCGVGNPFSLGPINEGDAVLDIGCGAGFDACVAARLAGPSGRVAGIDATSRMIDRARENLALLGLANVAFEVAEAEAIPFPDAHFQVVISNGVYNLALDKVRALAEAYRVLKPGGRFMVADMVLVQALPPERDQRIENWYQ